MGLDKIATLDGLVVLSHSDRPAIRKSLTDDRSSTRGDRTLSQARGHLMNRPISNHLPRGNRRTAANAL